MKKKKFIISFILLICVFSPFNGSKAYSETFYTSPGIVAPLEGKWVGSDHLFNLSNKLDVTVEILKPSDVTLPITEEAIKNRITIAFEKVGILKNPDETNPPLPFFHMLFLIYPIENGYAIYCDGRLFEAVKLDRVELPEETTFQAITWERQSLILTTKLGFARDINGCVDDIAKAFGERFQFFKNIKKEEKE